MNLYREHAEGAVRYVQSRLTIGARNKLTDLLRSRGGAFVCVWAARRAFKKATAGWKSTWKKLERLAATAERMGCGNCAEQAALAFFYLCRRDVVPIDYMSQADKDHAFVVLGRKGGSDPSKPASWGADAVVCDPWAHRVYLASAGAPAANSLLRYE